MNSYSNIRVHSFRQPNQPYQPYQPYQLYQPVFRKRIEPVDGRFWFRAFASLFFQRGAMSSIKFCLNNWVARLFSWKTTIKMIYFYCFLSKNCVTLCKVFSVHKINRLGGWLIWWTAGWWIFCFFDMVDTKRMDPNCTMLLQVMLSNAFVDVENSENRLLFVPFSQTAK